MKVIQRMLPLGDGKRSGIKLDSPTWQAVDWLAGQNGQTWRDWCLAIIHATKEDENITAAIRAAAMDGILMETILASRATLDSMMQDEEFDAHMRSCHIDGSEEMGGFTLHSGKDEFGRHCLWFENEVKGWPNLVIPMPEEK